MKAENSRTNFKGEPIPTLANLNSRADELCKNIREEFANKDTTAIQSSEHLSKYSASVKKNSYKKKQDREAFMKDKFYNRKKAFDDIKGFYVFAELKNRNWVPIYIGISQRVIERLRQHLFRKSESSATLACLMCGIERKKITSAHIESEQEKKLRKMAVKVFPFHGNNYHLQILEIMLAAKLKTYWNSFETH